MEKELPESVESKLKIVEKSSERIAHIVSSLKKFSRIDDAKPSKIAVPLTDIVKEALTLTTPKIKSTHTDISFNSSTSSVILCDEIEIEQILINLINNSIDAIKQLPKKWINISLIEKNENLVLTIADSGDGIPISIQDRIFDPFYTTKKIGEGTGLGLSIVKGMLEDHDASITLDNDSINTCFILRFPKFSEKT